MTLAQSNALRAFSFAFLLSLTSAAQTSAPVQDSDAPVVRQTAPGGAVPRLVKFTGSVPLGDASVSAGDAAMANPLGEVHTVTFALYAEPAGGEALWSETQKVSLDAEGRYSVLLGATSENGMPVELFATGQARWLEIRVKDAAPSARALLVSVPYALKAEEAERLSSDGFAALSEEMKASVREQMETALAKAVNQNTQGAVRPIVVRSNEGGNGTAGVPTVFSDSSTVDVVTVTQSGTGRALTATSTTANAIRATSSGTGTAGAAIYGINSAASGVAIGVRGDSASTGATAAGVQGVASGATGATIGVRGSTSSSTGFGVRGDANNTSAGTGVYGVSTATSGNSVGVLGEATGLNGVGVQAKSNTNAKLFQGIKGGLPQFTVDANGNITAAGSLTLGVGGVVNASSLNVPTAVFTSNGGTQTLAATNSGSGAGLLATNTGSGPALSATGATASSTAILANSNNGAKLFSGMTAGTEVFSVDSTGKLAAGLGSFSGTDSAAVLQVFNDEPGIQNGSPGNVPPAAIRGHSTSTTDEAFGLLGVTDSPSGSGVVGLVNSTVDVAQDHGAGVSGLSLAPNGQGVDAEAMDPNSNTVGVKAKVASATGIAVRAINQANGDLFEGVVGPDLSQTQVFRVDGTGTVTATAFVGDGSGITNITASNTASLGGVSAASFARQDTANSFTTNQTFSANTTSPTSALSVTQAGTGGGLSVAAPGIGTFPNGAVLTATATDAGGASGPNIPRAMLAIASSVGGRGLQAVSQATTGNGVGVIGFSSGDTGSGVFGQENSATGPTNGVAGVSLSSNGAGVYGEADSPTGVTAGVRGVDFSPTGKGVQGDSFPATDNTAVSNGMGVYGTYGFNSDFSVNALATGGYAGRFQNVATGGPTYGVRGEALSGSGNGIGVSGFAASSNGTAVEAIANSPTGSPIAVHGVVTSSTGIAGQFETTSGGAILIGVNGSIQKFILDSAGNVNASGTVTAASFSGSGAGLTGIAASTLAAGAYSNAYTFNNASNSFTGDGSGLTNITATNTSQLGGIAAANYAQIGVNNNFTSTQTITGDLNLTGASATVNALGGSFTGANGGLFGRDTVNDGAARSGVQGFADSSGGSGVSGRATSATGPTNGVFGRSDSTGGAGVFGTATATSGITAGVRGITASPSGKGAQGDSFSSATNAAITSGIGVLGTYGFNSDFSTNTNASGGVGVYGQTAANGGTSYGVRGDALNATGAVIGVGGITASSAGTGVGGFATAATGSAIAVRGNVTSSTGIAGQFETTSGGTILRGTDGGTQRFLVDSAGNVTATAFVGNGSGLTGLTGASTGSVNTFTANQFFSANLDIAATTSSTVGVITSGGNRFLYDIGTNNTFLGVSSGNFTLTGQRNTVMGNSAFQSDTSGSDNVAIGYTALQNNLGGNINTAVGSFSMSANTTGTRNTAVGNSSLTHNIGGTDNSGVGESALAANTSGSGNTAIGSSALTSNNVGADNTGLGTRALFNTTGGAENTATGKDSLLNNVGGGTNSAFGKKSLSSNTTGNGNTAVGFEAGLTTTVGNANTTGSNNTFIGADSGPGTSTQLTNATAIGANALVSQNNSVVLGDSSVSVGIRTQTPGAVLDVAGSVRIGSGGTVILKHLSNTGGVTFPAFVATQCDDQTVSVSGAATGDTVAIGVDATLAAVSGVQYTGFVSGTGTVTVRRCALVSGGGSTSGTVRVDVWQH